MRNICEWRLTSKTKQGKTNNGSFLTNKTKLISCYRNAKKAWKHLQEEKSLDDKVYVPKVYDEYTSKRVLVCEWVEGIQLTNVEALTEAGIDYKEAMKIAIDAFSSQIFRSGFVHGKILFFAHNLTKKK